MKQQTTYFQSLTLKNFRLFEEKMFLFDEQFNVLVGENGTGKSTVLDALRMSLSRCLAGIESPNILRIADSDIRGQIIHHNGAPSALERYYPCEIITTMSIFGEQYEGSAGRGGELRHHGWDEFSPLSHKYSEKLSGDNDFILPAFAYYGVKRANRPKKSRSMYIKMAAASRKKGYAESLSPSPNPQNFVNWLEKITYISLQEGVESDVMKATLEAIHTCLPEVKKIEFRVKEDSVIVSFDNDIPLRFESLSDGYRAVMALAADIAYRMATLNPHLGSDVAQKTPGIVLIDELDLHLHPKWQKRIVGDLKRAFPLVQFITTTHSPFIIQSLELGELINLGSQKPMGENFNALSIEDIAEEVMGISLPQRSKRYQEMYDAAAEYFDLLEQIPDAGEAKKNELESKLNALSAPFSDDVAYYAFLNSKRIAATARSSRKGKA